MYLKKLEMSGFKSFADKISLKFSDGITAIVGPNGSGKSNVVDAIKWVLGEQSIKSLRGSNMEDVLYKGNETRRASNVCSVSISLRNDTGFLPIDFNEVSIARKLYKSGDSEYLINNNPARLKDIIDLISDSGMSKTGYSILSQGEIDMILKNNPIDRRVIFEEAAGIIRFKNRKKTALNKLKSVDEDLLRLNDIIVEKERYLNSLKRQVAKAKRYKKLKNSLLRKVKLAYSIELASLLESKEKNTDLINSLNEKVLSFQASITKLESDLQLKNDDISTVRSQIISNKKILDELNQKIQNKQLELNNLKNKIENNQIQQNRAKREIVNLNEKIQELKNKISDISENVKKNESEKSLLEEKLFAIKDEFENKKSYLESIKYEYDILKSQIDKLKNDIYRYEQKIIFLNNQLNSDKIRKEELTNEIDVKLKRKEELTSVITEKKEKIDYVENYITNLKISIQNCNNSIQSLKQSRLEIVNEINSVQKEAGHISGLIKSLEDLNSSYEGYSVGVKHFLQNKNDYVFDTFADLIEVDKKYEVVIENYLNESLQSLIIDNFDSFNVFLNQIEKNNLNNIYLYVNDSIDDELLKLNFDKHPLMNETGFLSFASDIVKCNNKLLKVKNLIFNKVVIFDNISNITNVYNKYPDFTFLSLNKDVFSDGLFVIKKSIKNSGIIKRKRELKEYKNKLSQLENELTILANRENSVNNEINDKEYSHSKLTDKLNEKILFLRDLSNELKTFQNEIIKLDDDIALLNEKIETFNKQEAENVADIEANELQLKNLKIDFEEKEVIFNEKQEIIKETSQLIDNLKDEVYNCQISFNKIIEQINLLNNNKSLFESQVSSDYDNILKNKNEISDLQQSVIELNELYHQCEKNIEITLSEYNKISAQLQYIYSKEKEIQTALNKITNDIEELKTKRETVKDEVHKVQIELNKNDNLMDSLKTIAKEKYTIDLDAETEDDLESDDETDDGFDETSDEVSTLSDKDTAKDVAKDTDIDASIDTSEDTAKDIANDTDIDASIDTSENIVKDTSADKTHQVSDDEDSDEKSKHSVETATKTDSAEELNQVFNDEDSDEKSKHSVETATKTDSAQEPNKVSDYEDISLEELKKDISEIEKKIERIGSVNVDAITEYDELNKEYEFIIKQKTDLEEAEDDLKKLIRKIDKESKVKFVETFEQAKINFRNIISDIFPDGEGELMLIDNDDVLESGIDITVRMPGKRFQTISLLSGGERALVSIALLFSLLEIKPAPFCVLDEIDAPLDDANIFRFVKLVERFKQKTQFVVITHNKLTMEMCDTIYGVTMEELGVSKILSFKFENKKEKLVAN